MLCELNEEGCAIDWLVIFLIAISGRENQRKQHGIDCWPITFTTCYVVWSKTKDYVKKKWLEINFKGFWHLIAVVVCPISSE